MANGEAEKQTSSSSSFFSCCVLVARSTAVPFTRAKERRVMTRGARAAAAAPAHLPSANLGVQTRLAKSNSFEHTL